MPIIQKNLSLFDKAEFSTQSKINLAYLLGAAIVLDSSNFSPSLKDVKWSSEDTDAHEWLS